MNEDFNKKVEQYMLFDKKTLAELLAMKEMCDKVDMPVIPSYPPMPITPYPWPWYPTPGDTPWWPQVWYTTTSNGKEYENFSSNKAGLNRNDTIQDTLTNGASA